MSVQTAALVLAWICLVLLAFAMAGLLHQMRDLQARLEEASMQDARPLAGRRFEQLAGKGSAAVLLANPSCSLCGPVLGAFAHAAGGRTDLRFAAVSYASSPNWPRVGDLPVHIDEDLYRDLDVPWSPALLHVDAEGGVRAAHPIDSLADLHARLAELSHRLPSAAAS